MKFLSLIFSFWLHFGFLLTNSSYSRLNCFNLCMYLRTVDSGRPLGAIVACLTLLCNHTRVLYGTIEL